MWVMIERLDLGRERFHLGAQGCGSGRFLGEKFGLRLEIPLKRLGAGDGFGQLVFKSGAHCTCQRVNRGVINAESSHRFGAVRDHAREVELLGLPSAESLPFHRLNRDLATHGKHGGMEVGGGFGEVAADQFALVLVERRARGTHRLVFADREDLDLDSGRVEASTVVDNRLDHTDRSDAGRGCGVDGASLGCDPVGRRAHKAGREGIDRLAVVERGNGGGKFRCAGHGSAGRIDVEEHRLDVGAVGGFTQGGPDFLRVGRAQKDTGEQVRLAHDRAFDGDRADPVFDLEERVAGFRQRGSITTTGFLGRRSHCPKRIGFDQPITVLQQDGTHARSAVSTAYPGDGLCPHSQATSRLRGVSYSTNGFSNRCSRHPAGP